MRRTKPPALARAITLVPLIILTTICRQASDWAGDSAAERVEVTPKRRWSVPFDFGLQLKFSQNQIFRWAQTEIKTIHAFLQTAERCDASCLLLVTRHRPRHTHPPQPHWMTNSPDLRLK